MWKSSPVKRLSLGLFVTFAYHGDVRLFLLLFVALKRQQTDGSNLNRAIYKINIRAAATSLTLFPVNSTV